MNILSFLSGIFLTLSSIIGIHKEMPKATVLSIETTVAPTEIPTPLPTATPIPSPTPTIKIWPTRIPLTPTPDTKVQDLQKQIDELKKQVNSIPTPRPRFSCKLENGFVLQNEPCKYTCDDGHYSNVECN